MPTLTTRVVGQGFRDRESRDRARELVENERLILEREPENEYDSNAIKVLTEDEVHIGYIPKEENGPLADFLDRGGVIHEAFATNNGNKYMDICVVWNEDDPDA